MKKAYKKNLLFACIFAVYCSFMTLGCKESDAITEKGPDLVRPVKAIKLQNSSLNLSRTFPGVATAIREVDLSFRVRGPLVRFNLETGRRVAKGQVLARIDPRDFEVQAKALTAKLKASGAQKEVARLQFERYQSLIKEKGVAKAEFDQAKAAYETAEARLDADFKNLEAAGNALTDTVLKAPFPGFVHEVYVENHETVKVGQPVISLVDLSGIEVKVDIPENFLIRTSDISAFSCAFDVFPGKTFKASFKEVGKRPNHSNQTYPMILTLHKNRDTDAGLIRPGMTAEVTVSLSGKHKDRTFIVPVGALVNRNNNKSFVWICDPEGAGIKRQYVNPEKLVPGGVEISGELRAGAWVVTAGAQYLEDNQKIRILGPGSETNVGNLL